MVETLEQTAKSFSLESNESLDLSNEDNVLMYRKEQEVAMAGESTSLCDQGCYSTGCYSPGSCIDCYSVD